MNNLPLHTGNCRRRIRQPGTTERLHGAAHAARGRPVDLNRVKFTQRISDFLCLPLRKPRKVRRTVKWKISFSLGPTEGPGGVVIGSGSVFGGVKGAEPDTRLFQGISDLRGESAPGTFSYPSVSDFLQSSVSGLFFCCGTYRLRSCRGFSSPHEGTLQKTQKEKRRTRRGGKNEGKLICDYHRVSMAEFMWGKFFFFFFPEDLLIFLSLSFCFLSSGKERFRVCCLI